MLFAAPNHPARLFSLHVAVPVTSNPSVMTVSSALTGLEHLPKQLLDAFTCPSEHFAA